MLFTGPDALANLQHLLCNDFISLQDGRVRYSPMLDAQGGVIDDVLVYRFTPEKYLMVVNAANRHKDVKHILSEQIGNVKITDISDTLCQLALQGPNAEALLKTLVPETNIPQKYYSFLADISVGGVSCLVSRTGYTGEDGFEFYAPAGDAIRLFNVLFEAASPSACNCADWAAATPCAWRRDAPVRARDGRHRFSAGNRTGPLRKNGEAQLYW